MATEDERARRQAALEARFSSKPTSSGKRKASATAAAPELPRARPPSPAPQISGRLCTNCLHQGWPKTVTPGSIVIELFLWLCFLLPGLVYSLWRLTARHQACPSCGARNMIPANSPAAKKLLS